MTMPTTATLILAACAAAPVLGHPPDAAPAARPPFLTTELFAFHSEPEINLHHFLFNEAAVEWPPRRGAPDLSGYPLWKEDRNRLAELTEAERKTWNEALGFYRDHLIGRSLLFDRGLLAIRDALTGKAPRESVPEADRGVFEHLDRCLPIYESHWWPIHDRTNRGWVVTLVPSLVRYERQIASRITVAYGAEWSSPPNRVDVVAYADRTSAYTTGEPHSTISSANPALRMPWGLEILFHEHSHSDALEQSLVATVDGAFARIGLRAPRNLWHILLFATAGEVVRSVRVAAGEADYVPYAQTNQVFHTREIDRHAWESVEKRWIPALAKGEPLGAVIDAIAADLAPRIEASPR